MLISRYSWISFALTMATCTLAQKPGGVTLGTGLEPPQLTSTSCSQTGNTLHIYRLAEAGTDVPYRMYLPRRYNDRTRWPVIVMLHGRGLDENSPFIAANGLLSHLAEERGYIIVSPLGLRNDAGFGQRYPLMIGGKVVLNDVDAETSRLSEADVMNVVHRVLTDCKTDRSRIYLAGHSMGGLGAWYLGAKYSDLWAGVVVMAAAVMTPDYPLDRLRGTPFMLSQGTRDELSNTSNAREIVRHMNAVGLAPVYLEIEGATHATTYDKSLGAAFDFFDQHRRVGE